jgi:hypothetical protein
LDGCSRLFLAAFAAYVIGRYLGRTVIPLSGSIAAIALSGLILSRPLPRDAAPWTRYPLVAGLAMLAEVLALPDRSGVFAEALTAATCAAIGIGVLGRAGRLRRWSNLPAVVFAVLVIAVTGYVVRHPLVLFNQAPPDLTARAAAAIFPAIVVIMIGFVVNAALTTRGELRWAGAGLVPVLVLAITVLPALLAEDRLSAHPLGADRRDQAALYSIDERELAVLPSVDDRTVLQAVVVLPRIEAPPYRPWERELPEPQITSNAPPASAVQDEIGDRGTDVTAAVESALLLIGLAAIATALFPYRQ